MFQINALRYQLILRQYFVMQQIKIQNVYNGG